LQPILFDELLNYTFDTWLMFIFYTSLHIFSKISDLMFILCNHNHLRWFDRDVQNYLRLYIIGWYYDDHHKSNNSNIKYNYLAWYCQWSELFEQKGDHSKYCVKLSYLKLCKFIN
jgi:hypothetical protein